MKDRSIDGEQMHPKINKARRFSDRAVTVRWSLFLAFAFLILLISGTTLTVSFIGTSRLVNNLACSIIDRTQRQTETELHNLFDPIIRQVTIAHQWVKSGLVKRYDTDALNALFLPGMFHLPQCVSMMVSDMTGYEFTIFRNESGGQLETPVGQVQWVTRDFRPEEWGKKSIWTLWDEDGSKKLEQWEKDTIWDEDLVKEFAPSGTKMDASGEKGLVYDPRPRIWHKGSRDRYREWTTAEIVQNQQEAIYWTDIDMFFTSKAPGLTASVAVKDPKGDLVVIGYDLLLRDLSIFTRALQPTERGKVFVFTETGQIVGLPRDARLQNEGLLEATLLEPVENTGIPELVACMKSWQARQFDDLLPFRFEGGGQAWWAGFRPFSISTERRLWIGVVVPESDFLAAVRQNQFLILAICVVALAVATILAGYLSRSFARPLQTLVEKSRRISSLDLNPVKHVASHVTEIEQLSYSLEKMRSSLENHITDRLEAEQALQKAHDDLERRVEERTAELKRANEELQKEITERKQAQEQVQNLAKFPSENPFPVLRIAEDGTILYSNDAGLDLLGKWEQQVGEAAPHDWCQLIGDVLDSNRNKIIEVEYEKRIISFVFAPVAKAGYVNIYGRDVTRQKKAEQALQKARDELEEKVQQRTTELSQTVDMLQEEVRERTLTQQALQQSEARLRDAQRIAHIGNWDWDIVNNQLWWSDEIYHIFGLKSQEFGATYEGFLSRVHPHDREFVKKSVDEALYEQKPYNTDHRIVWPDGTQRIVHEQAEVIRNANNSPIRMRGTVQDITAQKQAEEKILDDQKQLRSLTAELLLSEERERRKIATDLHDSVGQILAFSDRELGALQKSSPEKLMKSVEEIRHHIKQAVRQTRTLTFDLSPPALYDLGFEAAVEELVEQFSKETKIECGFDSCDQHKPIADHVKILLYRSIRELLANVAKHSTAQLVRITSSRVNNNLQIIVEDNGTGFDVSKLEAKAGNSRGFGLFSIRERLTHIGGQFDVQSSNGKGTKITLLAPLQPKKLKKGRIKL